MKPETPNLQPGNILELQPEKWVQNGLTLCHLPDSGFPVFLHGALPGELVQAEIVKIRSSHAFAVSREIKSPAPTRSESNCSSFPSCGGCSFQHITYDEEIELKVKLLSEFKYIERCRSGVELEIFRSPPSGYRNNAQFQEQSGTRGFFALHSNRIVNLPEQGCANLSPELNAAVLQRPLSSEESRQRLQFRHTLNDKILGPEALKSTEALKTVLRPDLEWQFPALGFSQNNRFLIQPWLEFIKSLIPAEPVTTTELYCGSAAIGGFSREKLGDFQGFESSGPALGFARNNFKRFKFQGDFTKLDLDKEMPSLDNTKLLISNPPRAGMKEKLCRHINKSGVSDIIYSSCNPSTLNRDLSYLLQGGYNCKKMAIFDFFPRTPHLEMVVLLSRD